MNKEIETFNPEIHLAPKNTKFMGTYWVNCRDSDGRVIHGPDILTWQPGAKNWCYPHMVATGAGMQLLKKDCDILSEIPTPDIENDIKVLQDMRKMVTEVRIRLEKKEPFSEKELNTIRELCILHGNPI